MIKRTVIFNLEVENNRFIWFKNKKDALFFAKHYYNLERDESVDQIINEHILELTSEFICNFLNKRGI